MSCAVPRPMTEAAGWVTFGAGNRALWSEDVLRDDPLPEDAVAFPMSTLQRLNDSLAYPIEVGSLGQTLHEAGYWTGLVGGDTPYHDAAVMDYEGCVDVTLPAGTPDAVAAALPQADLLVINAAALDSDDDTATVIDIAADYLGLYDLLVVVALAPDRAPFVGLSPVVLRGPGFEGGALTSATTRRAGVAANIDLAPTILSSFRLPLPRSYTNGSVMSTHPGGAFDLDRAVRLTRKAEQAEAARPLALPVCFLLQAILVPLALKRRSALLRCLMLGLALLPLATYVTAFVPETWPPWTLAIAPLLVAALVTPLGMFRRPTAAAVAAGAVGAATAGVLLADILTGAHLQPVSLVGYTLGFGGRFYGIGNEAAGALMAGACLAAGLLLLPLRQAGSGFAAGLVLLVATASLAHPSVGANAGCTLAAVVCFVALLCYRLRPAWPTVLAVVLVAVVVFMLLASLDAARGPEHMSHIGRAWSRLRAEGGAYLGELLVRKSASAWEILRQTPVSFALVAWVLFWSYALLRPMRFARRAYESLPGAGVALPAIALGGLAAGLLNDTTVAIPAMMLAAALPVLGLANQLQAPTPAPSQEAPENG